MVITAAKGYQVVSNNLNLPTELEALIIDCYEFLEIGEGLTNEQKDLVFRALLSMTDSEGHIANVNLQKMFGIDFYKTIQAQEEQLKNFGIHDFLIQLPDFLSGKRKNIGGFTAKEKVQEGVDGVKALVNELLVV
ncbi:hypothetical protein N9J72_00130 [Candidatus Gracilibacteria bacterium]|nr:hypothetical protein [Candidatus Gracilibacteria bacterium]